MPSNVGPSVDFHPCDSVLCVLVPLFPQICIQTPVRPTLALAFHAKGLQWIVDGFGAWQFGHRGSRSQRHESWANLKPRPVPVPSANSHTCNRASHRRWFTTLHVICFVVSKNKNNRGKKKNLANFVVNMHPVSIDHCCKVQGYLTLVTIALNFCFAFINLHIFQNHGIHQMILLLKLQVSPKCTFIHCWWYVNLTCTVNCKPLNISNRNFIVHIS